MEPSRGTVGSVFAFFSELVTQHDNEQCLSKAILNIHKRKDKAQSTSNILNQSKQSKRLINGNFFHFLNYLYFLIFWTVGKTKTTIMHKTIKKIKKQT